MTSSGGRDVEPHTSGGEEALVTLGETAVGAGRVSSSPATPAMKAALFAGAAVFALGTLGQAVVIAWLAAAMAIIGVSGSILARTGGLDPSTFATCVKVAIVLDGLLLLSIISALSTKHVRREPPAGPDSYYVRHPVAVTAAWLLVGLVAVTLGGWKRSPYFPYPLATIVVLASAYFFALLGVLYTGALIVRIWAPLKAWAQASAYRTGAFTATLVLLGAAGFALRAAHWQEAPIRRLRAEIDLAPVAAATSFADTQLRGLCIAADKIVPELARGTTAPGCGFLGNSARGVVASGGAGTGEDCFTAVEPHLQAARNMLRAQFDLAAYDADDVAMQALLVTCEREPPPDNLRSYFFEVARNQAKRSVGTARRAVACDDFDHSSIPTPTCSLDELPETREMKLASLWDSALCRLNELEARVLRSRLIDDLSFPLIGDQWKIDEDRARNTFYNAIKKLRRHLANCIP
jgi:RNA polymerase sigma factor (sigma-70 family)